MAGRELDTELIFRPLRNTARVASNAVSREVVEILNNGGEFQDVKDLVAGARGVKVYENGDVDAGIWSVGTAMGLINDIPTCDELVARIVAEAEELITGRLADMVEPPEKRTSLRNRYEIDEGPVLGKLSRVNARRRARACSDRGGQRVLVVELLRGVALDQDIAVVERLEVNLDDISTGVVDPHDCSKGHH